MSEQPKLYITDIHFDKRRNNYAKLPLSLRKNFPGPVIQELYDYATITDPVRKMDNLTQIAPSRVKTVIEKMNQLFEDNIDRPPTGEIMLFGSTSNIDAVSYLNNLNAQKKISIALKDAVDEGKVSGKNRSDIIKEIFKIIDTSDEDSNELPTTVKTKAEVLGYVLRMFNHTGGRIKIADQKKN